MGISEDAKTHHKREKSDTAIGPLDTFIPQVIKDTPLPLPRPSYEQESREQGGISSQEFDVKEGDIDQPVIEKEFDDLKEQAIDGEQKSKDKDETEEEEQTKIVKEEVGHTEGSMRQK